ncbi:hypothetical protein [Nocardiopsis sp. CC223A]|uniref:hypothetical protein n=1 Tax=Nocardiopsis sp. CC223A TaxID=3044051 RepID=UPI00279584A2|nr:hypothetical protein [Nocardiopsis sp. CC223A]
MTKPSEGVEAGDEILSTAPEAGEQSARTVLATIIGSVSNVLVEITTDSTNECGA